MDDLIYRQQAIDAIDKCSVWVMYTQGDSQKDEAEFVVSIIKQTKKAIQSMLIEDLPSTQPDIIRCEDCVHADYKNIVKALWCSECGQGRTVAPNDFCSYGERRQNDG